MVPFDMLAMDCGIVTLSVRRTIFELFDFKNAMTLKTELGVRLGHWKCHHSTEHMTSYLRSIITMALSRVVSEIPVFNVEKYHDLEIPVKGRWQWIPFDRLDMVSFSVLYQLCHQDEQFLRYSTCNYTVTMKPGLRVTQGHQNRHGSTRRIWLPINFP